MQCLYHGDEVVFRLFIKLRQRTQVQLDISERALVRTSFLFKVCEAAAEP
ncbi:MAG: hypothetical protein ACYCVL_11140 [Gemmatimonadaceae bacterium]